MPVNIYRALKIVVIVLTSIVFFIQSATVRFHDFTQKQNYQNNDIITFFLTVDINIKNIHTVNTAQQVKKKVLLFTGIKSGSNFYSHTVFIFCLRRDNSNPVISIYLAVSYLYNRIVFKVLSFRYNDRITLFHKLVYRTYRFYITFATFGHTILYFIFAIRSETVVFIWLLIICKSNYIKSICPFIFHLLLLNREY